MTKVTDNPLLQEWETPFGLPPFDAIAPEHFTPAFDAALAEDRAEIDAIADSDAEPSFENTIDALELSGQELRRVSSIFFNLDRRAHQRCDPGDRDGDGAAARAAPQRHRS